VKVCVVGRGKVGGALVRALRAAGVAVEIKKGRAPPRAPEASVGTWILAVPDARLAEVAATLPVARGAVVLHCAGARGPEELAAARERGAHVAGFHPLVSFASKRPQALAGATFVARGDAKATRRARALARKLGARCIVAPVLGPAYHAAAALVANGGVALAHAAASILVLQGLSQRDAERALAGLLSSVARNLEQLGLPAALTGPVVRGDAATVGGHVAALSALSPALAEHYARVQPLVLAAARDAGLSLVQARAIEQALTSRGSRPARAPGSRRRSRTTATRAAARRR
jgi:predicted short-subunit dehydrogenase-like oxidoreductase (DUF2520 family)